MIVEIFFFRSLRLQKLTRGLKPFDLAISFRKTFTASLLLRFISANKKFCYKRQKYFNNVHLVEHYQNFVNLILEKKYVPGDLKIYIEKGYYSKKTLGLNPGATYGQAKRWYPERFAQVAYSLCKDFDIIIFGGENEISMAQEIEKHLEINGVKNYKNYAGKTTVKQLCSAIGGLDLFITADSGPMHIAAAYQVPTVAVFGPTNHIETSPWRNKNSTLVRKNVSCSPCMRRQCPKRHHICMDNIKAADILEKISSSGLGNNLFN